LSNQTERHRIRRQILCCRYSIYVAYRVILSNRWIPTIHDAF